MYSPTDLTQDRIIKLAQKMQDPEARKKAAYMLAEKLGPSPDEKDQMAQMMNPQGGQQPQLPPEMQMQGGLQPEMPQAMQPGLPRAASEMPPGQPTPQPPPYQMGDQRPSTLDEDQDARMQAQDQNRQKMAMAQLYDELGLTGAADPNDYWGKAAIAQEYMEKQSALRQQAEQLQQQRMQQPQTPVGGSPQPAQPSRQQMPNQNFDDYVGGKQSWSF